MAAKVLVSVVTYNSAAYIERCLDSVLAQDYPGIIVSVVDNASSDGTVEIVSRFDGAKLRRLERNVGFAAAQNLAIGSFASDYVLVLNPDVILTPGFISTLLTAFNYGSDIGSATGKLLRPSQGQNIIDSTGIYMTPNQRHLDRGSGEVDRGQYERPEYVFGASGAAALYSRRMLEDVAIDGEYFDEAFFAYREDADLAWRAQLLGWKCVYMPSAIAYHERRATPERRRRLPPEINMHSVKNRFLMRWKNMGLATYLRFLLPITVRDLGILGYILAFEPSSLPAVPLAFRHLGRCLRARRIIQSRKRVGTDYINRWFSYRPASFPLDYPPSETFP